MVQYKETDIQYALNLLDEVPVAGLKAMERMVAVATVLEHGTIVKEQKKEKIAPVQRKRRNRRRK